MSSSLQDSKEQSSSRMCQIEKWFYFDVFCGHMSKADNAFFQLDDVGIQLEIL